MYRIAICDDEEIFSESHEKICRDILNRLKIEYHISLFSNSKDFLEALLQKGRHYDLILLDIIMDGKDGMALARQIRRTNQEMAIIFITSSQDYVFQGYDVNALHYLIKPVDPGKLEQLILSDWHNRFQSSFLILQTDKGKQRVAVKDIFSLETFGRRVKVETSDGTAYYAGKLSSLLCELPADQFVRSHQAFALNIRHVREITRQDAIMTNGQHIPISRTFTRQVHSTFAKQLREGS